MAGSRLYTRDNLAEGDRTPLPLAYWRLARPFTLLAPALGLVSGGLVAFLASGPKLVDSSLLPAVLTLGALAAALLNSASNALNQICDLEIDRINKPTRPLCTGRISTFGAWVFTLLTGGAALILAAVISTITRHWGTFALFAAAAAFTAAYSMPPVRMKSRGWWANLTVAIPRGTLLKVAGWSLAQSVLHVEAWVIGGVFGLFLLGATTTKDFADIKGDGAHGVRTLPIAYGPRRAAVIIAPFLCLPFLLIPVGGHLRLLTPPEGNLSDLWMLGLVAFFWGLHVALRVIDDADALTRTENHPAWHHMYYLMLFMQVGFVLAYLPW